MTDDDCANRENVADEGWMELAVIRLSSEEGHDRLAMDLVAETVRDLLPADRLEQLKTAVAEGALNAIEHGNRDRPEWSIFVRVYAGPHSVVVRIIDYGKSGPIIRPPAPNIDAKLTGEQPPRGWGLFLMEEMVDELHVTNGENYQCLELVMHREGERDEQQGA